MPNDPFKRPAPAPTPAPAQPPRALAAPASGPASAAATTASVTSAAAADASNAAVAASAGPDAGPAGATLGIEATSPEVRPGEVSVVNLTGISGLGSLSALEVTVEWDPAVAEVTGIAPGEWQDGADANSVRFDADRTAGRAHLHFTRAGSAGLPDGVLARLAVKGTTPGVTLLRATAGVATTPKGVVTAPVVGPASLTVKAVP